MTTESSEGPLVTKIILLAILILNELFVLLIDGIIGQMHILVVLIDLGGISFTGESSKTLLEDVDPQWLVASDQHIDTQIKFMAVDQKWVCNVS
jgi:hypothetical protein